MHWAYRIPVTTSGGIVMTANVSAQKIKPIARLLILLLLSVSAHQISASALTISNLRPVPNYSLSTDSHDRPQLADGKIENYPIWLSQNAVGWQYQTPVRIDIALPDSVNRGTLKLHTACGTHADVFFPRRIDIYTQRSDGGWQYITTTTASTEAGCRRDAWLTAEIKNASRNITERLFFLMKLNYHRAMIMHLYRSTQ
jgi:hypothetical protein